MNMSELRKPNGDYTEEGLRYPGMKADIDCKKYSYNEIVEIIESLRRMTK